MKAQTQMWTLKKINHGWLSQISGIIWRTAVLSDADGRFSEKYFAAHKGLVVKSSPSLNYLLLYHTSPAHPPPQ